MTKHTQPSRRAFLKQAASVALAPYVIPSTALAAPSERVNLAVIGVKKMGGGHVDTLLRHKGVRLVAICDVRRDLREATRRKIEQHYAAGRKDGTYRGCDAYNDYEDVMARDDIDAVVIATPDHWHAIIAIAACRAGKDVYCEKPLSRTIGEARQMVRAARRYGTVFQTGSQQRSDWHFRRACELIRNGCIGQLQKVHVEIGPVSQEVYLPEEPVPPGFDYDRWLGPAPWAPYNKLRVGSYYDDGWRRIRDLLRREDDRLGRTPLRHCAMGPGHGRKRPGRDHPTAAEAELEAHAPYHRGHRRVAAGSVVGADVPLREWRRGHQGWH